jgi:PAS domain S-box-containing protein
MHLLVEQSRDGIVVLDRHGKVFQANERFADMLGYTLEEVHQLRVWDWDAMFSESELLEMIRTVDRSGAHFETKHRRRDGTVIEVELSNNGAWCRGQKLILCICRDVTERNRLAREREELISELQTALEEIRTLRGIIPICCVCKKVRDDKGYWEQVDAYLSRHTNARFSHGICPDCISERYPGLTKP